MEWAAFPLHPIGGEPRLYPDIAALLEEVYGPGSSADGMAGQRGPLVAAIEALRKTRGGRSPRWRHRWSPRERAGRDAHAAARW